MLLAHITDIHVAREEDYQAPEEVELAPRIRKHSIEILENLLDDLVALGADHVVLTGDLTQTSKESEFRLARKILDERLDRMGLTTLPGNHDRWREEAIEEGWFETIFDDSIRCDLGGEGFPACRLLPDVAIVSLDSSPFVQGVDPAKVCGHVSREQLDRLVELSSHPEIRSRFLVVALHHHLRLSEEDAAASDPKDATPLLNAEEVEDALEKTQVGLILHGHRHRKMELSISLAGREVPVICPGSSSRADPRVERTAKYGLYELQGGRLVQARYRMWDPFAERVIWLD